MSDSRRRRKFAPRHPKVSVTRHSTLDSLLTVTRDFSAWIIRQQRGHQQPGNLEKAVKRGWENLHFRSTTSEAVEPAFSITEDSPMSDTQHSHAFTEHDAARDIADVPAIEVINTVAVHLLSAAAVKCGLADDPET